MEWPDLTVFGDTTRSVKIVTFFWTWNRSELACRTESNLFVAKSLYYSTVWKHSSSASFAGWFFFTWIPISVPRNRLTANEGSIKLRISLEALKPSAYPIVHSGQNSKEAARIGRLVSHQGRFRENEIRRVRLRCEIQPSSRPLISRLARWKEGRGARAGKPRRENGAKIAKVHLQYLILRPAPRNPPNTGGTRTVGSLSLVVEQTRMLLHFIIYSHDEWSMIWKVLFFTANPI